MATLPPSIPRVNDGFILLGSPIGPAAFGEVVLRDRVQKKDLTEKAVGSGKQSSRVPFASSVLLPPQVCVLLENLRPSQDSPRHP